MEHRLSVQAFLSLLNLGLAYTEFKDGPCEQNSLHVAVPRAGKG